MKLTLWTYEGPPHVGAMRVATAMKGLHLVLHAPQGDTYADLLFTMIERRDHRPPVSYTTFQARDLGADTAGLFKTACRDAVEQRLLRALTWLRGQTATRRGKLATGLSPGAMPVVANRERLRSQASLVGLFFGGGVLGAAGFQQIGYVTTVPLALLLLVMGLQRARRPREGLPA